MLPRTDLRLRNYAPFLSMASHVHDEASMNIVVSGDFQERIGKSERNYTRGHIAFFPAGVTHSQEFGAAGARQIIFQPMESWLDYLADCRTKLEAAPHHNAPAFRRLGDRLLEEMRSGDEFSAVAREGILLEVVATFGRTGVAAGAPAQPPAWLRRARDYLNENACAPLGMKEVAHAAGRHEIHLAREFRRFYSVSVGNYLRQLRAEEAARLLLKPSANISGIAIESGFSSHSHLCRVFKAHFGVTPAQYRRAMRSDG